MLVTFTYFSNKQTKHFDVHFERMKLTCPEVDDEIGQEDGIRNRVEDDPSGAEFVVEEGDDDWQDDEVRYQQDQHRQIPVEPAHLLGNVQASF